MRGRKGEEEEEEEAEEEEQEERRKEGDADAGVFKTRTQPQEGWEKKYFSGIRVLYSWPGQKKRWVGGGRRGKREHFQR